jgi:putative DNA primase/helicase
MSNTKRPFKKIDVMLLADELTHSLNEVVKGLRRAEEPVFQMNGRLVTLLHHNAPPPEESEATMEELFQTPPTRRPAGALILHDVNDVFLTEIIGRVARFYSFDHRASAPRGTDPSQKGAWKPTRTPPEFGRHILARGQWALRILLGTVESPTLRPDGTVVQDEGYDAASGLYLDLNGAEFPPVPDTPTRVEALEALKVLTNLISTFPFVPGEGEEWGGPTAARSVALSAMLTAVVRRSIATAPAHAIVAPTPGTGKTKLSEIASVMATGRTPTAISYGKTQEEFEKRLFAVLLAADP